MKKAFFLLMALLGNLIVQAQVNQPNPVPQTSARKIQIAILFDTSGSMDGLIEQAKSTIWQIVNAASDLRVNGSVPVLEIALYDYGNSGIGNAMYVRKQVDLISDLDSLSGRLFALSTNGGDEYCAAVIQNSLKELKWSTDPNDLKIIYIAGNEPFNQGPVDYKVILKEAAGQNVIVNTIYCGPYDQGVREFWYDGALIAQGNYFNIDSNKEAVIIETPYDETINSYNDSLNQTYMGYGRMGMYREMKQAEEDENAGSKGASNISERAVAKSKANYTNASWDLIDAQKNDSKLLDSLKKEDLPEELQGKTKEEQQKIIDEKRADRERYQKNINELAVKRTEYVNQEKAKRAAESGQEDLGSSIIKSMNTSAEKIGYTLK